jgi:hypothetical protein
MAVGAVALRVEALRELAGSEPFRDLYPGHEDWDLWLRLSAAGAMWGAPVGAPLFDYRMRSGSMSRNVGGMWRSGLSLIASAPVAPGLRLAAQRRWTIRSLARASAGRGVDAGVIAAMLEDLDARGGRAMGDEDRAAFTGALRHGCMVEHATGPAGAMEAGDRWRSDARSVLAAWGECVGAIESVSFDSWVGVAERLGKLLRREGRGERGRLAHLRPVVAGMGRNGRALAAAVGARGIAFDWLDEDESAVCAVRGARRVGIGQVAPRHLVIVTPAAAEGLVARLRETRALVMRPGDLVEARIEDAQELVRRVA